MRSLHFSRRDLLRYSGLGLVGASSSGWFPLLAARAAGDPQRRRQCILLWMSGGPSQTDTFDMKPDHENGGEFREIQTAAPGLRFSEHLPKLAAMADKLAVLRGLNTKEGDHGRGTYLMRTGHKPLGPVQHPSIGASLANHLGDQKLTLPNYISIGPYRAFNQDAFGAGFLGPKFGPLVVGASDTYNGANNGEGFSELKVEALERSKQVTDARMEKRLKIWTTLQSEFLASRQLGAAKAHHTVYQSALELMNSKDATAFDLSREPDDVRQAYGRSVFGQGCLLARRLIERGVAFVEVSLGTSSGGVGWDTHSDNFNAVKQLSADLDSGWGTLMRELDERGLLDSTTILWMGEFGRTPQINGNAGRDHFPAAWSTVLAGGGIAGGQAYGKTSEDGTSVMNGQIGAPDLLATLCEALGVGGTYNTDASGRPIPITERTPVKAVLA
jgi:hypothetical protein